MSTVHIQNFQEKVNLVALENEVLAFWDEIHAFETSIEQRASGKTYHFYDGPPFATGLPHYGHIVASLMKDAVPRFWTMKGYKVDRKWGWDCHGLPIENIIEKELNLATKKDIEAFGVGKFNEACRATVLKYASEWKKTVKRMGRWVDMEHDYKTMDMSFMESTWWVFKEIWDHNLIYKGHKAMHICPRCETPLSNFEVTQGYKTVKDLSVIVKFLVTSDPKHVLPEKSAFLAWTTTPWTLPGNLLLAIQANETYAVVSVEGQNESLVLAKARIATVFKDMPVTIVKEIQGSELVGIEYAPIFPYFKDTPHAFRVVAAGFVTMDEGVGIVHIAPAFGDDDYAVGKSEGLPFIQHVKFDGTFIDAVTDFAGMHVKPKEDPTKTDIEIIKWLAAHGVLVKKEKVEHSYPHCWRCDTPLLNYATSSWFIKVTDMKQALIANNKRIHWVPENMKEGRFGQWLDGVRDWAVSRNRYWGTPLPIWESEDGDVICVGSVAELETLSGKKVTDLHKHIIDGIQIEKNGKVYSRIPEVLDCWFESGSMPYGQMHYPFENKKLFEESFPAQFIAEGQDQTRGWFYTLHVLSTALTMGDTPAIQVTGATHEGTPGFQNVIVNGIVLAADGKKMSKKLKNYPDPDILIEKYGADAVRYYLITSPVMEAESLNFSEEGVREVYSKVVNTMWNVLAFYKMYEPKEVSGERSTHPLDAWVIAKLHACVKQVTEGMENYELVKASRPIGEFVTELSQWYVRRSRERLKDVGSKDATEVSATLQEVLMTLAKISAPFMPFMAEVLYQNIGGTGSVHWTDWPVYDPAVISLEKEKEMEDVRYIVERIHAKRKELNIPVRQPLSSVTVSGIEHTLSDELLSVIKDEVNIKAVILVKEKTDEEVVVDTELTPELKEEGQIRELVRKIQTVRKEKGVLVDTEATIQMPNEYASLSKKAQEQILKETRGKTIIWGNSLDILIG